MANVLVVEDDMSNAQLAALHLKKAGHQVVACDTGLAALAWLDRSRFDLVVMDLGLPDLDGLELIGRIRIHPSGHLVPLLVVTANGEGEHKARASGVDHVLLKPYDGAEFRSIVARLVGDGSMSP